MEPVTVTIQQPSSRVASDVQKYIINSLSSLLPTLIPFALRNQSIFPLSKYLKYDKSGSPSSLAMYIYTVHCFCQWCETEPDDLVSECMDLDGLPNSKAIAKATQRLDQYHDELKALDLAPKTVGVRIAIVKSFYRVNKLLLPLTRKLGGRTQAKDRAPTPDELRKLVDLADLRGKVAVSVAATGGFREGTESQLVYRHIKKDFEAGIIPCHVHVEAEITKGKYNDYDSFLGREAVEYIRAYMEERKRGTAKIPPEIITDESPLIRDRRSKTPKPVYPGQIYEIIHSLYAKAGLLGPKRHRRYEIRPHSLRKFFRTQMAAGGVERDYIDYMMGHTVSTYHDIQMKGIEFLRNIYCASGLSITPKTQLSKIEALKQIVQAWGMNPDEVLTREAMTQPHRTYVDGSDDQIKTLSNTLKDIMRKELLDARPSY